MKLITTICLIISLFFLVRAMHLFLAIKQKRAYPPRFWLKQNAIRYALLGGIGLLCTLLLSLL
ncbi:hypothetical protein [Bacillus manliponensis]|uniref:hypothetical protein n=1 Tax=Bacillus manliponensis TaxID=574376 RepID=UPI0035160997